jgi:hypothetical protein
VTLLLILLYDAVRLFKEAMWRELIVLLLVWSVGSALALTAVLGIDLPNPNDLIIAVFGRFTGN